MTPVVTTLVAVMEISDEQLAQARDALAKEVAARTGVRDQSVIDAIRKVPRHSFIDPSSRELAYVDRALPLFEGQTISQPSMLATMLEQLDCRPEHRVLEIGAGSGYAAALLAQLVKEVHAVEIRAALADRARQNLASAKVDNVEVHLRDGSQGLPERAPFDRVLVSAAPEQIPPALVEQLTIGGIIAIPVGTGYAQVLRVGKRREDGEIDWRESIPCLFVPLVSEPNPQAAN